MEKIYLKFGEEVKFFGSQLDLFNFITEESKLVITSVEDGRINVTDADGNDEQVLDFGVVAIDDTKAKFEETVVDLRTQLREHSDALKTAGLPLSDEQIEILKRKFGFLPKK